MWRAIISRMIPSDRNKYLCETFSIAVISDLRAVLNLRPCLVGGLTYNVTGVFQCILPGQVDSFKLGPSRNNTCFLCVEDELQKTRLHMCSYCSCRCNNCRQQLSIYFLYFYSPLVCGKMPRLPSLNVL